MKVLQINAVYGFGSTGLIVKDIGDCLVKNGHQSFVAYAFSNDTPNNSYKIGNEFDRKLHALHARIFGKQGYASKGQTKKFLRWVGKIKPDIVHLHNLHSNYINFNMLCDYLANHKIPTVITLHDCWYFTGKCTHYAEVGCDKWQTQCGNCSQKKLEQASLFVDASGKVLKDRVAHLNAIPNLTVVGCSQWISKQVGQSLLKPTEIKTIYNGVNTKIFTPRKSNFREQYNLGDKFCILGMAQKWFNVKNKEVVEKLITHFAQDKIILVGCSEKQKQFLKKFPNVLALGFIKEREILAEIYSSANVFVNLTYADTLPTVNMESICCGTPVVTWDSCGSPELVTEKTGFVVKQGDVKGVLQSLDKIKKENVPFDVEEGQKRFDKDTCYSDYVKLYQAIWEKKE